jgi:hypothetical protein
MDKAMKKKLIAVAVVAGLIVLLLSAIALVQSVVTDVVGKPDETSGAHEVVITDDSLQETTDVVDATGKDVEPVDTDMLFADFMTVDDFDIFDGYTLSGMKQLTLSFDGLDIRPGITPGMIIDTSHWYSLLEHEMLDAGEVGYMILNNDFWTNDEIQLNNEAMARNGEIILWVRNYGSTAAEMRDCVVYKYKINYRGCGKIFTEQPKLNYLNKFVLGYQGAYDGSQTDYSSDDDGEYVRHIYGDVNSCQVIFDSSANEGLFAVTVFCNEFYGPDFGIKGGDNNG